MATAAGPAPPPSLGAKSGASQAFGQPLLDSLDDRGLSYIERFAELTAISDELLYGSQVSYVPPGTCHSCGGTEEEEDGLVACAGCARVAGSAVDRSAESRGMFDDSRRNPVERSDVPVNPLYPNSSMASTVHVDRRGTSTDYNSMRLAKRSGMVSKERPRDAVFKRIEAVCFNHKLTPAVVSSAKHFYSKVAGERTSRGALKRGLVAACAYFACEVNDTYKPEDAVAAMFGVTRSQLIQGKAILNNFLGLSVKPPTAAKQVVMLARNLGLSAPHMELCERVCERAARCDPLVAYVPRSIAAGAIMLVCDAFGLRTRKDVVAAVGVSALTLSKVTADMNLVQGEVFPRVEVRLVPRSTSSSSGGGSSSFGSKDSAKAEAEAEVEVRMTAVW